MKSEQDNRVHFVSDGQERALKGAQEYLIKRRAEITARVEASYASKMESAGILHRVWLRIRMNREIRVEMKDEMENAAPADALYISQT